MKLHLGISAALLIVLSSGCGGTDPEVESAGAAAGARPLFQLPFLCGQTWQASTYNGHWPDQDSIDLGRWDGSNNISGGEPVLASASGTVLQVFDAAVVVSPPHGNAIYIDHGNGWVTHYLHLANTPTLAVGDVVARGQQIGVVGNTGTEAMHLHYSQLADGMAVRIAFGGTLINTHAGNQASWSTWGNGEELTSGDEDGDGLCDSQDHCLGLNSPNNVDSDGDGIGNVCDLCPDAADPTNLDSDGDGVPDACDLCPTAADSTNLDTDGDGLGDICDNDDDGDGCFDADDLNPKDAYVRVGTELHPNCSPSSTPHLASERGDNDGDAIPDCADPDDDNDGIPDVIDECPLVAGDLCIYPGQSCPLNPIFFTCRGGGCNWQILRIQELVNPDPTRTTLFDIVSVNGLDITVTPLANRSVAESASAVRGALPLTSGGRTRGALKMEVVSRSGRVLADVASYQPSSVQTGRFQGSQLVIRLGKSGIELMGR